MVNNKVRNEMTPAKLYEIYESTLEAYRAALRARSALTATLRKYPTEETYRAVAAADIKVARAKAALDAYSMPRKPMTAADRRVARALTAGLC